ncbi:hypothetical protein CSA37_05260 [Candidatus Fermentibacteria bacterium]|nr:MAG: hypothetical protein CSA37_05260 [Candidatus Fermentibacteria bacterium]
MQILLCVLMSASPAWELTTSLSYIHNTSPSSEGGVWCASSGGAFHYTPSEGTGTVYSCPEHLPVPDCRDILEDSSGRIWFATGGKGLLMLDGSAWSSYSNFEGIPGQGTVTALEEAAGKIWVGSSGGFAYGDQIGFTPVGDAFSADNVYSISVRNDTLWLCTEKGVYTLSDPSLPQNPDSWLYWEGTDTLGLRRVRAGESSVFACGDAGVVELSPQDSVFRFVLDYSAEKDSSVIDVLELDEGLLAACHGQVLIRSGGQWSPLGSGIPSAFWPTCLFTVEDQLHCGFTIQTDLPNLVNTQSGLGFYILSSNTWSNYTIPGMQCKRIHQISITDDGKIFTGSYLRGVQAYYPGEGWRIYSKEDGMSSEFQVFSVAADPAGGLWTSSYTRGLSWIRDNGDLISEGDTILTFYTDTIGYFEPWTTLIKAPLPNNQPVMLTSQENGMWGAFQQFDPTGAPDEPSGIMGFNGDPMGTMSWAPRVLGSGIAYPNVHSVYPASNDSLWIAFADGGGCQLLVHSGNPGDDSADQWYPGNGQAYTIAYGLPSSAVYCFTKVPGQGLFLGTGSGLARWDGNGFTEYGDVSGAVEAMAADEYGRLWCLGESGVSMVADGSSEYYDEINSDFVPSTTYNWEYAAHDPFYGGVRFSSIKGLWRVRLEGGGGGETHSAISLYPQPFISEESVLRIAGLDDNAPVSVSFYRLDGTYAGSLNAESVQEWAWNGTLRNKVVASGVYIVTVSSGGDLYQEKITVVR